MRSLAVVLACGLSAVFGLPVSPPAKPEAEWVPKLTEFGVPEDTPEVQEAKAQHLHTLALAGSRRPQLPDEQGGYGNPPPGYAGYGYQQQVDFGGYRNRQPEAFYGSQRDYYGSDYDDARANGVGANYALYISTLGKDGVTDDSPAVRAQKYHRFDEEWKKFQKANAAFKDAVPVADFVLDNHDNNNDVSFIRYTPNNEVSAYRYNADVSSVRYNEDVSPATFSSNGDVSPVTFDNNNNNDDVAVTRQPAGDGVYYSPRPRKLKKQDRAKAGGGEKRDEYIPVIENGVPLDTPEVLEAKQRHFAAHARASELAKKNPAGDVKEEREDDGEDKTPPKKKNKKNKKKKKADGGVAEEKKKDGKEIHDSFLRTLCISMYLCVDEQKKEGGGDGSAS